MLPSLQLATSRLVDDLLSHTALPEASGRINVLFKCLICVSSGIPRRNWRLIMRVQNPRRMTEVLPEAIRILEHGLAPRNSDVVNQAQMGRQFRETHGAVVWDAGHVELGGHQHNSQALVDAAQSHGVDLTHIGGLGLQELLEGYAVLGGFAGGDANAVGLEGFPDGGVAEDVIGVRGLCGGKRQRAYRLSPHQFRLTLNEDRLELHKLLHVLDSLRDAPDL